MMTTTDGRAARRHRNREAVLDAVVELFERGMTDPAVEEVSELSGVSTRSMYRYFHHRDQLIREAMWHLMGRLQPEMTLERVGEGSLDERIDRFVDHRISLHRALGPLTRAAKRASSSEPMISDEFEAGRLMLRQQLLDHFAPEFDRLEAHPRTRAVISVDLAFQFDAFEYLASACEHEDDEMRELLRHQLRIQFAALRN